MYFLFCENRIDRIAADDIHDEEENFSEELRRDMRKYEMAQPNAHSQSRQQIHRLVDGRHDIDAAQGIGNENTDISYGKK